MGKKSALILLTLLFLSASNLTFAIPDYEDIKFNMGNSIDDFKDNVDDVKDKVDDFKDDVSDFKDGIQLNIPNPFEPDMRKKEAKHKHQVEKQEAKEEYERKREEIRPSGFMTVEEYEQRSMAVDHSQDEIEIPKPEKESDMKYVPQYTYKIVRYNNPPGTPELSIKKKFYTMKHMNMQGIASPDFTKLVYPVVYYYANGASVACELFVIPLDESETNLNKLLKANVKRRLPDPILSTDRTIDNALTFRTLTPIDFSQDGNLLLVKEKIGSSADGIWQTNAIVYHFDTKVSYDLVEVRDAIMYYWKENKSLDLADKRWDIYPIGFDINNPDRVIVQAYGFTGDRPVFLGTWSIDSKGEQSRLETFVNAESRVSMNGFKLVQDGVVNPGVSEAEEKQLQRFEREKEKAKKQEEKEQRDALKEEYKAKIQALDEKYYEEQHNFNLQQRVKGSTSDNDAVEAYEQLKAQEIQKFLEKQEKLNAKEQQRIEKLLNEAQKYQDAADAIEVPAPELSE